MIDIKLLNPLFKIYFNIVYYSLQFEPASRNILLETNFKNLPMIFTLFGNDLWPYLKYMLEKLVEFNDNKEALEVVKISLIPKLADICEVLGEEIVEGQLLPILHKQFLNSS